MPATPPTPAESMEPLMARGDFRSVIEIAERDISAIRRDAHAGFLYGLACASTGALPQAAEALAGAMALAPANVAVKGALTRVLILLGDRDGSERLIEELSVAAAAEPMAASVLIEAYLQGGRAEDAYHAAIRAANRFGALHFDARLAEAAVRTRRIGEGIDAAQRAESRQGLTPAVINVAGPAALLAGDSARLGRLTAIVNMSSPERAAAIYDFWTGVLMAGDHFAAARRAAELAAAALPSPLRWRLVCDLRLATRDADAAQEAAQNALEIDPADSNALSLLARCRIAAGDIAEAKSLLEKAAAVDPDNTVAFDNLTQIDPGAMTPDMAAHLEGRIAADALPPDARSKALLALARRDETLGAYARAFDRVIEAKTILSRAADMAGRGYRPRTTDVAVDAAKKFFPAKPAISTAMDMSPRPVFVLGMPRSGTTLVEQILSSHSKVFGAGELPGMINILNEFGVAAAGSDAQTAIAANGDKWRARYRAELPAPALDAEYVVDKHPLNFWGAGLIASLYSNALIVNLTRPAVDVCLSILRVRFFTEYEFANSIEAVAHYYAAYERMIGHWRGTLGERLHDVDYAALVCDPEGETRKLLDYCGLPFEPACLEFHRTRREVVTHSAAQVREPINARGVERRKKYGDALKPLEDALARYGVQASQPYSAGGES